VSRRVAGAAAGLVAAAAIPVLVVHGPGPGNWWNLAPLAVAALVLALLRNRTGGSRFAAPGFALFTAAAVAGGHLAWVADLGGTATGSSTSGLLFVVLPFLALGAGLLGAGLGVASGTLLDRGRPAGEP